MVLDEFFNLLEIQLNELIGGSLTNNSAEEFFEALLDFKLKFLGIVSFQQGGNHFVGYNEEKWIFWNWHYLNHEPIPSISRNQIFVGTYFFDFSEQRVEEIFLKELSFCQCKSGVFLRGWLFDFEKDKWPISDGGKEICLLEGF